jgi:hypothetical protein
MPGDSIRLIQIVVVADCDNILSFPGDPFVLEIDRIARPIDSDGVGGADIDHVLRTIYVESFRGLDRYLVVAAPDDDSLACSDQLEC